MKPTAGSSRSFYLSRRTEVMPSLNLSIWWNSLATRARKDGRGWWCWLPARAAGGVTVPEKERGPGEADESERSYDRGALAALGPRLASAGVPAVVAMQDNIQTGDG